MADGNSPDGRTTRHDGRRQELMDAAVAYVFREGLSDLSLRPMAKALGISHFTLLHHFGSKDELIQRVLSEVRTRQLEQVRQSMQDETDPLRILDVGWRSLSREERIPFWRAFFEVYGIAVKHPDRYRDFLDSIVKAWLPWLTRAVIASGTPKTKAARLATLMQATLRGLILDLLTTGERERVEDSYKLLCEILRRELKSPNSSAKA